MNTGRLRDWFENGLERLGPRRARLLGLAWLGILVGLYLLAGVSVFHLMPIFDRAPSAADIQPDTTPTPIVTAGPTKKVTPSPAFDFYGIDFGNTTRQVDIRIQPKKGEAMQFSFLPGHACDFGSGRGCVFPSDPPGKGRLVFLTLHSGLGGEAEAFRERVEGSGINQAGFTLKDITRALKSLKGASVSITQGKKRVKGLELAIVARIPGDTLKRYFDAPLDEVLLRAAEINPDLRPYIESDQPLLVFETCGWKHPAESWSAGLSETTGAIYLGIIRQKP